MAEERTPLRDFMPILQGAALVEWTGTGLFLAVSTVYFVKVVGLSPASVGTGLTVAGAVAMGAALLGARLAAAYGPRRLLVGVNLARAVATLAYLWVDSWSSFLLVAALTAITDQSAPPLIQAYVGARVRQDLRTRVMALQRTVVNVGISLGGLIAGVTLGSDTRASFRWLLIGGAVAYVLVAVVFAAARGEGGVRRETGALRPLLRDRRLRNLWAFGVVMALWTPILNLAFPLWLLTRTDVPQRMVGVLYAVNTVACIALQYPMNRFARTIGSAWRSYAAAAVLLALTCVAFAVAPSFHGAAVPVAFTVAVLLLTAAELLQVGAAWTLSYELAPAASRSAFLVLFGMGRTAGTRVAGPLLMTGVVLASGAAGWIALAAAFLLSGLYPLSALRALRGSDDATAPEEARSDDPPVMDGEAVGRGKTVSAA